MKIIKFNKNFYKQLKTIIDFEVSNPCFHVIIVVIIHKCDEIIVSWFIRTPRSPRVEVVPFLEFWSSWDDFFAGMFVS